ncbi:Sodium/hydrogen exchanger family-domain-containing protein [Yarrowia lipolytica]|uniref:Sodium/hydrogen exchanger family-domain-containing protein n=1 Tax=Yarrowia lipolytica TaxID=4952 RepID=A0A371C4R4_YARLL|nr:Na(+)/H(+) antiporter [Yarrowia lipolytica]RDW25301.1 Sodium/hydrogen exchanger family-domain-containing protein [Yarrowia lipolytica]RDW35060.1 Sodium/hydrogen exchanger family-domain-containing protein [Yarrowia lipolytica]RDW38896.1 Sodium/hydrogen exchanger family-domain-containing protein [Yarrowia lipolytica]RDW44799.1 Sodium/hydrogen exchanger family-domain-containing protein [Yarrowia lipolytica]
MGWDQLGIDDAHLAYAIIGTFTMIFSVVSLFVKEKLYIGEATVATLCGLIVGPHCLKWFTPDTWGNTDYITLELSRVCLVIQIFAVAVELPKKYIWKHALSVFYLLFPIMAFGWLISSLFIWALIKDLRWKEGLVMAACITATDPVLASAVVGKGRFSQRLPTHLRNLLSAESGCNDGMAFPFTFISLNLILHYGNAGEICKEFFVITVLYECMTGICLGIVIGWGGRILIKFAESRNLIDRESFLAFYLVLALMCAGFGTIIGVDDLLAAFAAGTAFSWDGWFAKETEESHVSNVIDLLLNTSFFVYFGSVVPWADFNNKEIGLDVWRLVVIAVLILLFRRIPAMLILSPLVPDIRNWREALFCGHFGPIGVGAVYMSLIARAELESGTPSPRRKEDWPKEGQPNWLAVQTIWPVCTFLIISSIVVHGSSLFVFFLGKHVSNLSITINSTTTAGDESHMWISRLPGIGDNGRTISISRVDTREPGMITFGEKKRLAKQREREAQTEKHGDEANISSESTAKQRKPRRRMSKDPPVNRPLSLGQGRGREHIDTFVEGDHVIQENDDGDIVAEYDQEKAGSSSGTDGDDQSPHITDRRHSHPHNVAAGGHHHLHHERVKAVAYKIDDELIVENEDGDILKRYKIRQKGHGPDSPNEEFVTPKHEGGVTKFFDRIFHKNFQDIKDIHKDKAPATDFVDLEKNEPLDVALARDGILSGVEDHPSEGAVQGTTTILHPTHTPCNDEVCLDDPLQRATIVEGSLERQDTSRSRRSSRGSLTSFRLGRRDSKDGTPTPGPSESDIPEETPAEKRRRMSALGLGNSAKDDDDEEEQTVVHPIREDEEDAPRIMWGDTVRG